MSFKDKRFRYGSFSTVMIVAAVALFVLVNIIVDQLNISYDLTRERIFSLSDGSVTIARELTENVTIYSLWPTGQENFMFQQLLEEYASHSNRITVQNRDPLLHPGFVEYFAEPDQAIANGSIIVVGPYRHRVIHAADLISTELDWGSFPPQQRLVGFNIEPQVTNALNFVVRAESPVIYRVTGNNEFPLPPALINEMEMAGYEVREFNLMTQDVPEEADILFITLPERDWSPDQAQRILDYLENDGRAIFILGYRTERFPRFDEVLAAYGLALGDYVIIEGNPNNFFRNNPLMHLPDFMPGEITDMLIERNFMPLIGQPTGIDLLDLRRTGTTIEPLIRTSNQAYGRQDPLNTVLTRVPEDVAGPFYLAVTVEDVFWFAGENRTLSTRMVVISAETMLLEDFNTEVAGSNWSFLINSLNWLREEPSGVFIRSRAPATIMPLFMTEGQAITIAVVSVLVLPLIFAIGGLVVWLRRRNA